VLELRKLCCTLFCNEQKQKRNNAEPTIEECEELDVVEAFKTCHTSSRKGLSEPAREAVVRPNFYFLMPFSLLILFFLLLISYHNPI